MRLLLLLAILGAACISLVGVTQPAFAREFAESSVVIGLVGQDELRTVLVSDGVDGAALQQWLSLQPAVSLVGMNQSYQAVRIPNDPFYSSQNHLTQINAPGGWDYEIGSSDVVVAVLDTGVDTDHPDLASTIWVNTDEIANNGLDDDGNGYIDDRSGWNFINDSADPNPAFDAGWTESGVHHGTAIAGVIGAVGNNAVGVTGVAWTSQIMPVRVLDSTGTGNTAEVYNGIRYAVANGADIINLSFVGSGADPVLAQAIADASAAGVLVVAAAGNNLLDLDSDPRYPVCMDQVLGVGGVNGNNQLVLFTSNGQVTGGSNYGSNCIDVVAPAQGIYSTSVYAPAVTHPLSGITLDDYYLGGWSGTSLASPMVAGTAALLKSHNPSLTPVQLSNIIQQTATRVDAINPSYTGQLGSGLINVAASINWLLPSAHPIITAAGTGGGPQVRLFNSAGVLQSQFFAYATTFRGGVNVAAGDVDGDGIHKIITGVKSGGAPHVRMFDSSGRSLYQFFAYATTFRGGVNVAAGDVDGDGVDEIITGAGNGGAPHVRVFDKTGKLRYQFFAYATTFRGGVNVASGDLTGDRSEEIITGTGLGSAPHVRVFNRSGVAQSQFFAYATTFRGGVNVAIGDVNSDGVQEIITAPTGSGGPHVRVFTAAGAPISQLFAFPTTFRGGVSVTAQ